MRFAGRGPSRRLNASVDQIGILSLRCGGVEFLYQPVEGGFELWLILIGMSADEIDDLTVVIGGLFVVAACLVDHP